MYVLKSTICFIGMPGAGKTTLAGSMAAFYNLPAIDLDEVIEKDLGTSISTYWKSEGELAFRCLERFHLLKVFCGQPVLLSSGGGTPCFFDNFNVIRNFSFSIYLKMKAMNPETPGMILSNPVFSGSKDPVKQWNFLLNNRKEFYEKANCTVDTFVNEPNVFENVSNVCLKNKIIVKV